MHQYAYSMQKPVFSRFSRWVKTCCDILQEGGSE